VVEEVEKPLLELALMAVGMVVKVMVGLEVLLLQTQEAEGEVLEITEEPIQQVATAVQASLSSRFPTTLRLPFQAVLLPRFRLRYQDLRFTP